MFVECPDIELRYYGKEEILYKLDLMEDEYKKPFSFSDDDFGRRARSDQPLGGVNGGEYPQLSRDMVLKLRKSKELAILYGLGSDLEVKNVRNYLRANSDLIMQPVTLFLLS